MADISEFACRCADEFAALQDGTHDRFDLQLPRQAVEELVKAVFYASMIPDEGRSPYVSLMCYRKGCEQSFHFLFAEPLDPTPQEIAKLAHAVERGGHLCCICDDGKVRLGGVHVTVLNDMREFGYSSFRPANPLKLVIQRPGHIEMSSGGIALVYKAGEVTEERLFQHSQTMGRLCQAIEADLRELTDGTVEALESVFNDLVEEIVHLGHGGILIVAKTPKASQFSSLRRIDCLLLRQLLVRYWNDVARLTRSAGGAARLAANPRAMAGNPHALAVASDTAMLEKCIASIGQLAGVDGAIVLNYACKVAAFNAIIDRSRMSEGGCRLVDSFGRELPRDDVNRNRGSRHQSALAYAEGVPNSFVFVISQDGGISAFHNPGDGTVMCETGMRVLE